MANIHKYINSGRLSLFNTTDKTGIQYNNSEYNKFGPSFTQENNNFKEYFESDNKEFWIKEHLYFNILNYKTDNNNIAYKVVPNNANSVAQNNTLLSMNSESNSVSVIYQRINLMDNSYGTIGTPTVSGANVDKLKTKDTFTNSIAVYKDDVKISNTLSIPTEQQLNMELHVKSDSSSGIIELFINSKLIFTFSGNILNGDDISYYYIGGKKIDVAEYCTTLDIDSYYPVVPIISSIIISNTEKIGSEEVLELPVKDTTTDWIKQQDGSYVAEDTNKTLFQSIDYQTFLSELNSKFNTSTDILIKTIAIQGENSYYNKDSDMKSLDILIKQEDTEEVVDSVDLGFLETSPLISKPMNINEITSSYWLLRDLSTTSFGVRTK